MTSLASAAARTLEQNGHSASQLISEGKIPPECKKYFPQHPEIVIVPARNRGCSGTYSITYDGNWDVSFPSKHRGSKGEVIKSRMTVTFSKRSSLLIFSRHRIQDIDSMTLGKTITVSSNRLKVIHTIIRTDNFTDLADYLTMQQDMTV